MKQPRVYAQSRIYLVGANDGETFEYRCCRMSKSDCKIIFIFILKTKKQIPLYSCIKIVKFLGVYLSNRSRLSAIRIIYSFHIHVKKIQSYHIYMHIQKQIFFF